MVLDGSSFDHLRRPGCENRFTHAQVGVLERQSLPSMLRDEKTRPAQVRKSISNDLSRLSSTTLFSMSHVNGCVISPTALHLVPWRSRWRRDFSVWSAPFTHTRSTVGAATPAGGTELAPAGMGDFGSNSVVDT